MSFPPRIGVAVVAIAAAGAAAVVASSGGGSPPRDPFAALRRPLHLPTRAGGTCPVSRWHTISRAFAPALGAGPVYPIGFDADSTLELRYPPPAGSQFAGSRFGGQKTLWVARRSYKGPILVRGRRLDGSSPLRFDLGGGRLLRELRFPARSSNAGSTGGAGWRQFPTHTRLRAGGCYAFQVDGTTFSRVVVFRATVTEPASVALGKPGCAPASPLGAFSRSLPEAKATTTAGSVWALFFPAGGMRWKLGAAAFDGAVGKDFKIVFRLTGSGDARFSAHGPDGQTLAPVWGPEPHGGSTWTRPGDEWGLGFRFPTSGCWRLHAERTGAAGDVWVIIR